MRFLAHLSTAMAGLLVGLGIAVFARAVKEAGFDHLVLGHIVGPGLVAAGLVRIRLQRMLDGPARPAPHPESGYEARGEDDDG
jgi:hypothetical protein